MPMSPSTPLRAVLRSTGATASGPRSASRPMLADQPALQVGRLEMPDRRRSRRTVTSSRAFCSAGDVAVGEVDHVDEPGRLGRVGHLPGERIVGRPAASRRTRACRRRSASSSSDSGRRPASRWRPRRTRPRRSPRRDRRSALAILCSSAKAASRSGSVSTAATSSTPVICREMRRHALRPCCRCRG